MRFGDTLYKTVSGIWYDRAQKRAMEDPEYRSLESRRDLDGAIKSSDRFYELCPVPKWLEFWRKVQYEKKFSPRYWRDIAIHYRQRVQKGYSYRDLWSFDHYLAALCEGAFIDMRDNLHGWPGEPMTFEEWKDIHTTIADGFKAKRDQFNLEYIDREQHDQEYQLLEAKWLEAMELFTEYFGSFWD